MTSTFTPAFDINPTGTTAALGRNLRLRRLFGADGRTVTVALDQAVPRGVAPRLATIGTTFASIAEGEPDAVTITKGLAGPLLGGDRAPLPWILKASMFSVEFHPTYDATIATVQDAVRLGADAVAVGISAGSSNQVAMFEMLTRVVEEAHTWGLPVVCHAYPSGEMWGDRRVPPSRSRLRPRCRRTGHRHRQNLVHRIHRRVRQGRRGHPGHRRRRRRAPANSPLDVLKQAASVVEAGAHGITARPKHLAGTGSRQDGRRTQSRHPRW